MAVDPLSLIPAGSEFNTLRATLGHLRNLERAGYGNDYSGLANQRERVLGWVNEIRSGTGRTADDIRDDIVRVILGPDLAMQAYGITRTEFDRLVLGGNEGGINLSDLRITPRPSTGGSTPGPRPNTPSAPSGPTVQPTTPTTPEPVDYAARVRVLFPYLADPLVKVFADAWADSGDTNLALAEMRSSPVYEQYFAGNRRPDGTVRHSELEYFSIKEGYRTLYREFGLNPDIFEDKFVTLIENDQSVAEHAGRLGAAYEGIVNNIPTVRDAYARYGGLEMSDQAIFASVINPEVGQAIISRQISVAQVGGEGLARGFDVSEDFAGRLVSGGVDQSAARTLFSTAEGQLSTLNELVRRHHDPDDDFDIEEFADANVFGDEVQTRRIRRALRAEAASFSDRLGSIAINQDLAVSGLTAR